MTHLYVMLAVALAMSGAALGFGIQAWNIVYTREGKETDLYRAVNSTTMLNFSLSLVLVLMIGGAIINQVFGG